MSYTKTTWATGDVVTATKLNNIETCLDAIGNRFIVTLTISDNTGTGDKTWNEILAAFNAGKDIWFQSNANMFRMTFINSSGSAGYAAYSVSGTLMYYTTITGSGDSPVTVTVHY